MPAFSTVGGASSDAKTGRNISAPFCALVISLRECPVSDDSSCRTPTTLTVRCAALHVPSDVERDGPQYLDGGEQIRLRAAKLAAPVAHVARIGDVDLRIEGLRGKLLHVGSMISARTSRTLPLQDATAMPTPTSVAVI